MSNPIRRNQDTRMVPLPSESIIPERDLGKMPVLECKHLGIDFGGLTAARKHGCFQKSDCHKC